MRKLSLPQDYEPEWRGEQSELRVIAVKAAGSPEAALQMLIQNSLDRAGLAALQRARPDVAAILCQLVDDLDGLAYQHPKWGLLPLAREPLRHHLSAAVSLDMDGNGMPDPAMVAGWLVRFGKDADYWWGGVTVITDRGYWQLGDRRPVRECLAAAARCHIARRAPSIGITNMILDRLPSRGSEAVESQLVAMAASDPALASYCPGQP
jgi:hypothetical protein